MPVRLRYSVELNYQVQAPGADFVFNVQAARTRQQRVLEERLELDRPAHTYTDPQTHARYLRVRAPAGPLRLAYSASVEIEHHAMAPDHVGEILVDQLPAPVLPYLYPSRYCESDRLHALAVGEFGRLWLGHRRAQAIRDWVQRQVAFRPNTSNSSTSAVDTLASRQGVCRDFAHLMIALCRAVNIPARFATGLDYGADPALGPPDFHAYVEAYLGHRWYLFDPSGVAVPMGLLRIGTGRDAADAAFATIFGPVQSQPPRLRIDALPGSTKPHHCGDALSTDAGLESQRTPTESTSGTPIRSQSALATVEC